MRRIFYTTYFCHENLPCHPVDAINISPPLLAALLQSPETTMSMWHIPPRLLRAGVLTTGLKRAVRKLAFSDLPKDQDHLRAIVHGIAKIGHNMKDKSVKNEWVLEDLPGSMQRLVLFEGKGVSIALHHIIADDFLVHNHRRPFYSYCISGGYRHRIYSTKEPTLDDEEWLSCRRGPKGAFTSTERARKVPQLLLDTRFEPGATYLINTPAKHQVDAVVPGTVTLVVKSNSHDSPTFASSEFLFQNRAHDPNDRPNSGRTETDLTPRRRNAIIKVFQTALQNAPHDTHLLTNAGVRAMRSKLRRAKARVKKYEHNRKEIDDSEIAASAPTPAPSSLNYPAGGTTAERERATAAFVAFALALIACDVGRPAGGTTAERERVTAAAAAFALALIAWDVGRPPAKSRRQETSAAKLSHAPSPAP